MLFVIATAYINRIHRLAITSPSRRDPHNIMILLYAKDPKMTVAELGQPVANLNYNRVDEEKMVAEQNARLDEEVKNIEAAYDTRRYYDFAYFKSKTKEQLLNIVMYLQRTYFEKPKNF